VYSTQGWGLWVQKFSPILFFVHNFGYRYARYPFKGCKDADFCLVSDKILIQHNGSMGWGLGPGKSGKKNAKTPPLVAFPPESVKPETKNFFSIATRRFAESVEGLNSSLSLAAGKL